MNAPTLDEMVFRLSDLEARLAQMVGAARVRSSAHQPPPENIPWHVIAAAVAAVVPGAIRIKSVSVIVPLTVSNSWSLEGRREHLYSHRLR